MKFANANLQGTRKNAHEPDQILASEHEKVHSVIWLKKYSSTFFSIAQSKRVFGYLVPLPGDQIHLSWHTNLHHGSQSLWFYLQPECLETETFSLITRSERCNQVFNLSYSKLLKYIEVTLSWHNSTQVLLSVNVIPALCYWAQNQGDLCSISSKKL